MIVAKKNYKDYHYNYDNYAYDYKRYADYDEVDKKKIKKITRKSKNSIKNKVKLIFLTTLMLCTGILIISRYALIMKLNNQNISFKNQIISNEKVSDDLKLKLLKYYDIKEIDRIATTELNMVRPYNNMIHIKIASNNIVDANISPKPQKVDLISRIVVFINSIKGA